MKEINEVKKSYIPIVNVNPQLNKYDEMVSPSKKLEEANENITKYGLPPTWEEPNPKKKAENSFWITGILKGADAEKNTFILVSTDVNSESIKAHKTIKTSSDKLTQLVHNYWDKMIKVYIKPMTVKGKSVNYELIDMSLNA
jgi:hypothetical protein